MRIASLVALVAMTCGLALAARHSTDVTYVGGNLTGIVANSPGTLILGEDKSAELKSGLATITVPYEKISKAELGSIKKEAAPLYQVWSLHKRLMGKTTIQQIKLEFTSEEGEQRNMTVELPKSSAEETLAVIQSHTKHPEEAKSTEWWGDRYWKTKSNSEAWTRETAKAPK